MTYFSFLLYFIIPPVIVLLAALRPARREWMALALLAAITYAWTIPWDNYFAGSGVWYYDPRLTSNLYLGWVPLEEYLFFSLQCWLTSLWVLGLMRIFSRPEAGERGLRARRLLLLAAVFVVPLVFGFSPLLPHTPALTPAAPPPPSFPPLPFDQWNYLTLILLWTVPVITLRAFLGYPVFRVYWPAYLLGILVPTVYLTALDALAIGSGTWVISPEQSLNVFLPGGVPIEEGVFFLATNTMVVQGWILITSPLVHSHLAALWRASRKRRTPLELR